MADSSAVESVGFARGYNFACVLYPDNPEHMWVLEWFKRHGGAYSIAYILHDRDVWTVEDEKENSNHVAGSHKKAHYHLFFRRKTQATAGGLAKFFGLSHVELIDDPSHYLNYMIHDTRECYLLGKTRYDFSELHGNASLVNLALDKNLHFAQLRDIATVIYDENHTLATLTIWLDNHPAYKETFNMHSGYIINMINEKFRLEDREYNRQHPFDKKLEDIYCAIADGFKSLKGN